MSDATYGQQLRAARKSRGLTIAQAATLSGVVQSQLSRLENDRGNPSIETLRRIAATFLITPWVTPEYVAGEAAGRRGGFLAGYVAACAALTAAIRDDCWWAVPQPTDALVAWEQGEKAGAS